MGKWQRIKYHPNIPLYEGRERVTGSAGHISLSRKAAGEGMVLLKNERGILPFEYGKRIAVFGKGSVDYVKGGGGSGDVTVRYKRSLADGLELKAGGGKLSLFSPLNDFYRKEVKRQYENGAEPGMTEEPDVPAGLMDRAAAFCDTAVIVISRFSGEGWDRKAVLDESTYDLDDNAKKLITLSQRIFPDGDYYLTWGEKKLILDVKTRFKNIVAVLNVGGMTDTKWFRDDADIAGALLAWQAGMEGGLAAADILCGDVNPSGKLADTFAGALEDYPSTAGFHESVKYVEYTDDIFVGYRYFETEKEAAQKVNYPFGFGLSYTDFTIETLSFAREQNLVRIDVSITNTGRRDGREVVQIYYAAPNGRIKKPANVLCAFRKSRLLSPGETEFIRFEIPFYELSSYDEKGDIREAAWVMESGGYEFFVGNSVRSLAKAGGFELEKEVVTCQLSHHCRKEDMTKEEPALSTRLTMREAEGLCPGTRAVKREYYEDLQKIKTKKLEQVSTGEITLDEFMEQLSVDDMISLLGGQPNTGVANTCGFGNLPEYGVPSVMTADGPAGLRILPECGVYTTAWPCATLLACTWDPDLIERIGRAGAEEVKENGMGVWLAPGMNIHRSPLCGRNFEYYSEDPFLAGKMGAAMVKGIQSMHIAACPKHFACNNKETNRKDCNSRVSERALREIYLKAFEIVVRESSPYCIMTSYNPVNGVQASENRELITEILRGEWGYEGLVMTDWWTQGEQYIEIKAGNDLKMATGFPERVREAYDKGLIAEKEIKTAAARVLDLILRLD